MYFIKFDILSYISTLKNNNEDNNLLLRKSFQNDLNVFANKVKLINDENLQQFRKITLLNTQPIVKNNNYFKEILYTDSEDNNSKLNYLSDNKLFSNKNISNFSLTSNLENYIQPGKVEINQTTEHNIDIGPHVEHNIETVNNIEQNTENNNFELPKIETSKVEIEQESEEKINQLLNNQLLNNDSIDSNKSNKLEDSES